MPSVLRSIALAALLAPAGGGATAGSLQDFAESMFAAVGSQRSTCAAPDAAELRYCADTPLGATKLEALWERGIGELNGVQVESVSAWLSEKMLHWRYYVIDGQPIVVQLNDKSKSLVIVGSATPRCETPLPEGMFEVQGATGEVTPPQLTYSTSYAWAFRAHRTGRDGRVLLNGTVSTAGRFEDVCLDRLEPPIVDLLLSAVRTVRGWKFTPAQVGEQPIEARMSAPFDLRPGEAKKVLSF